MTVYTLAWMQCDWCKRTTETTPSAPDARDAAYAKGWRRRKKGLRMCDICPQCIKEQEQAK